MRFVHTKYLIIDALSDDPILITGSANFRYDALASIGAESLLPLSNAGQWVSDQRVLFIAARTPL